MVGDCPLSGAALDKASLAGGFAAGKLVPREFVRLVRDALVHLYDPARLLGHPLAGLLEEALPATGNKAQALRVFLLDTIECLEPAKTAPASEKERRPYTVLVKRYVGGLTIDEIAAAMHIGARQVRREHERGVAAMAAHLWSFCQSAAAAMPDGQPGGTSSPGESLAPGPGLQDELATLGVELACLPLSELLSSIREPARLLATGYGAELDFVLEEDGGFCLCDRTLARQAILSCIGALVSGQPRHLEVRQASSRRQPGVLIEVRPSLPMQDAAKQASPIGEAQEGKLDACRALMAAQGGDVRLLAEAPGLCRGVLLCFRSESRAHVLVVDDNEKMRQLYSRYLALGRYQVSMAASALQAEELLQHEMPDAIVLDVMMRGMDGWEFLQRVRARPELKQVPVIVCSVLDEPKLALLLGAEICLKKPVVADDLLQALQRLLGKHTRA
ncbi:MAG: response regulator [Anaerolineae bacterium]